MHNLTLKGMIKRRFMINFRFDPEVMRKFLPEPFSPRLHNGYAIAGICLIRLEHIRPAFVPWALGLSGENSAHRFAVHWEDQGTRTGLYIPRRDAGEEIVNFNP